MALNSFFTNPLETKTRYTQIFTLMLFIFLQSICKFVVENFKLVKLIQTIITYISLSCSTRKILKKQIKFKASEKRRKSIDIVPE